MKDIPVTGMFNEQPAMINLDTMEIAPSDQYSLSYIDEVNDYKQSGCEQFFEECPETDIVKFVTTKFLNACGIDNDNWISNFITSYQPSSSLKRFFIPVTNEAPETFTSRYSVAMN